MDEVISMMDQTRWKAYCRACARDGLRKWLGLVTYIPKREPHYRFRRINSNMHLKSHRFDTVECPTCHREADVTSDTLEHLTTSLPNPYTAPPLLI